MSEKAGLVNCYTCEKCGGKTITINAVEGVTPFMIKCRANWPGECDGFAQSCFYQTDQDQRPDWEWYKPTEVEMGEEAQRQARWNDPIPLDIRHARYEAALVNIKSHVEQGGLLLRRVTNDTLEKFGYPGPRAG